MANMPLHHIFLIDSADIAPLREMGVYDTRYSLCDWHEQRLDFPHLTATQFEISKGINQISDTAADSEEINS